MRHCPLVLVVLLSALLAPTAFGQGSTSWGLFSPAAFRPEIGEAQMAVIVRALGLDEDGSALARDLHRGHTERVRREGATFRTRAVEIIEEAQIMGDGRGVDELYEMRSEWSEQREALDDAFLDDLKLILSEEQLGRWSTVERELRRMDLMGLGAMAGESTDLTLLVEGEGIEMTDAVVAVLERYAAAMDSALRARQEFFEDHTRIEYKAQLGTDPQRAERLYKRARGVRQSVRAVNLRFIEECARAAGPDDGPRLRARFTERVAVTARRVDSLAELALEGAAGLNDLTGEQERALDALRSSFEEQRDAWLERYAGVLMEVEDEAVPDTLAEALGEMSADDPDRGARHASGDRARVPALEKIWRERLAIDRTARRAVYSLLTDDQRARMPLLVGHMMITTGGIYGVGGSTWY